MTNLFDLAKPTRKALADLPRSGRHNGVLAYLLRDATLAAIKCGASVGEIKSLQQSRAYSDEFGWECTGPHAERTARYVAAWCDRYGEVKGSTRDGWPVAQAEVSQLPDGAWYVRTYHWPIGN